MHRALLILMGDPQRRGDIGAEVSRMQGVSDASWQSGGRRYSGREGRRWWVISPEGKADAKMWVTCMAEVRKHFL